MKCLGATGAACVLLILLLVETGLSTRRQSVGWDEGDHIFAGYASCPVRVPLRSSRRVVDQHRAAETEREPQPNGIARKTFLEFWRPGTPFRLLRRADRLQHRPPVLRFALHPRRRVEGLRVPLRHAHPVELIAVPA